MLTAFERQFAVILCVGFCSFFFFSSRRRHTRCREVSWARRCVQETARIQLQESLSGSSPTLPIDIIEKKINDVYEKLKQKIEEKSSETDEAIHRISKAIEETKRVLNKMQSQLIQSESSKKLNLKNEESKTCLLYTSDAADDTPCVDLGGRRIIKKKKIYRNLQHTHKADR
eukprot:TRINITY_DN9905_c0_g1_i9.p1 TRINITY_DN9905_c0_g1~~TRINITY_DN9905_c0_g1_i9.p1  ORF type:complete len:172 (-),score=57.71 TRINITY_DN9905_c0_g1_i9:65-580(-)